MNKLNGTPYLLLKDFGEKVAELYWFIVFPNNSFREVLPQLPVIAMILPSKFSLTIFEDLVKNSSVSKTLICLFFLFKLLILLTTAIEAPFLKASST